MGATLYEPINVYKPLAPNIGVVDGPFEYFTVAGVRMPIPFTTRMTVIRLGNGDLFRIIVNLAAGGGTDFLARLIGEYVKSQRYCALAIPLVTVILQPQFFSLAPDFIDCAQPTQVLCGLLD
jgi:hypothetical protein